MKSIVIYFSQTGNTRRIAQAIQAGIKQVSEQCDIVRLKEAKIIDLSGYDLVAFGSPIWRLGTPVHVMTFLKSLPQLKGKHAVLFCTHGALPVTFMLQTATVLRQKGVTVIGWADWYGGCFLPYLPKPYLTDGHPDEIDMREAEEFGREMAKRSQRIYAGETNLIPVIPEGEGADPLWQGPLVPPKQISEVRQRAQEKMRIDTDKCKYPACTLCIDNCPMNSIDFSVSPPVFRKSCVMDWFCEQVCPEGAIEVDYAEQCVSHDIIVSERYVKNTSEAEVTGRFRRLVPLERLQWSRHQHEITGHPRLIPD